MPIHTHKDAHACTHTFYTNFRKQYVIRRSSRSKEIWQTHWLLNVGLCTMPQSQLLTADTTQRDVTWISSETGGYLTSCPAKPENGS